MNLQNSLIRNLLYETNECIEKIVLNYTPQLIH